MGVLLNLLFGLRCAVPVAEEEAAVLYPFLKFVVVVALVDVFVAEAECLLIDVFLNVVEQFRNSFHDAVERNVFLFQRIAAHYLYGVVLQVASAHCQTHGHALEFVVGKLETGAFVVAVVVLHADAELSEPVDDGLQLRRNGCQLLVALEDWHDDNLYRSYLRRQHEPVVVGMCHDERTYETGAYAPRCSPDILGLVLLIEESNVERLGKVLPEEVRRAALECLSVLHHGFDGVGVECSCKAFGLALHALHHRNGEPLFGKVGINFQHSPCFFLCFLARCVCRVPLLPQEFRCTEEGAGAHFPPHDVAPLVAHERQVAVRVYPVAVGVPYNGLARGADNEFFVEPCGGVYFHSALFLVGTEAVVCNHGTFLGKPFHVFSLAGKEALRDKKGEIGILCARFLKHFVQLCLHLLPYSVSVRLYYHTAADGRLFCQIGFHNKVVVPL